MFRHLVSNRDNILKLKSQFDAAVDGLNTED
jgi:hypothetical protein